MYLRANKKCNQGLTLIELMIAMLIGTMLLSGTLAMFISNKRIYKEQESMGRLQENARFGLGILMYDIRMAGYTGCSNSISNVENHVAGASGTNILDFSNAVEGSESKANWLPTNSTDGVASMLAGTDGISVRYLDDTGLQIQPPYMPTASAALQVTANNGLIVGEIVGVADCDSADIFQISNANPDTSGTIAHNTGTGTPGNATKDLQKKYLGDASIVKFISRRYFIATGAYGGPSLFRNHFAMDKDDADGDNNRTEMIQHSQELIEGVENMQILYGEDTSSDKIANTYLTAANVTNWDNVVSVRLSLLFRTVEVNRQIDPDSSTYTLLGGAGAGGATLTNPGDQHRRRIFTSTIQIRNRST
jgi:type IV pilus assembly protein PilW